MDEEGATGGANILVRCEVNMFECGGQVDHAAGIDLKAVPPEKAAEHDQVLEEGHRLHTD